MQFSLNLWFSVLGVYYLLPSVGGFNSGFCFGLVWLVKHVRLCCADCFGLCCCLCIVCLLAGFDGSCLIWCWVLVFVLVMIWVCLRFV